MNGRLSILAIIALSGCGPRENERDGVPITRTAALRPLRLPTVAGPDDPSLPLIMIDPGHGGRDPGALAGGLAEKDVTLALARAIRDTLLESGRVRVALTRDGDEPVPLSDRPEMARRLRAGLFLSIHADAAGREGARGASIYTLSEVASDEDAAALARRENASARGRVPSSADGTVARILADLASRESLEQAADFARLLHREAAPAVRFRADHRRFAALAVLRSIEVPSVLFECGYLTNAEDAAFLRSAEGRKVIAERVGRAVDAYFARRSAAAVGAKG